MQYSQYPKNSESVRFGVDAIAFRDSQLWQEVPIAIKDSSSLEIFKAKVKLWSCDDCVTPVQDLSPV